MIFDVAALQRENAEQRAQIAQLLSTQSMLVLEVAKLNDRVGELLAVAQRKQRKAPASPAEKKPETPPVVEAEQQKAFDARPTPPALPEKTKAPARAHRRTGRNAARAPRGRRDLAASLVLRTLRLHGARRRR